MRSRILSLVCGTLVAYACGSESTEPNEETPAGDGEIVLILRRSPSSIVPLEADSAIIRVWHETAGLNAVQRVAIPDPNTTQQVQIPVPARTGYSVGVLAFRTDVADELLAGGIARNVDVVDGGSTLVSLQVTPWLVEFSIPDALVSAEQYTVKAVVTQGPVSDVFDENLGFLHSGLTPWTTLSDLPSGTAGTFSGDTLTFTYTAPTVNADTSVWLQVDMRATARPDKWGSSIRAPIAFLPSLTLGDTLVRRPITLGGGTIIIEFAPKP